MVFDMMPDPALLVLGATTLAGCSGIPGLLLRHGPLGQRLAASAALLCSLLALPALIHLLLNSATVRFTLDWNLPFGPCEIALDPLSSFFLIPIFLVFPAGSLYALGYWPASTRRNSAPSVTFFYGLLPFAMALVVVARNGAFFLMAWELMALAAYFLLVAEHGDGEVLRAGTVFLVASHLGGAALLVLFTALYGLTGTFQLPPQGSLQVSHGVAAFLLFAALAGFGSKAGLMPLHIWLPSAHANAPSHVSALLSGVMLKIGVYGLLRVCSFFPHPPLWWGALLTVAGLASALAGICIAASQKDIKRLLAYSSIENLGIICAGTGVFLVGKATGNPGLAYLGLAGALFHILNHAVFKPLLFFCAGSVMHATGERDLDRMGGLARRMPWTAFFSLCGAVAICGLPPFNGFASEMLLYLGFFGQARSGAHYLVLGAPVLALVGGVALITFVKLYGIAFLGAPRTGGLAEAHEASSSMLAPMSFLAFLTLLGGLFPQLFLALVNPVVASLEPAAAAAAPLPVAPYWFALAGGGVLLLAAALFLLLKLQAKREPAGSAPTWGCGYLAPAPSMQYTGSSFGHAFGSLAAPLLRFRIGCDGIAGITPAASRFHYETEETLLQRMVMPGLGAAGVACAFLRRLQHGEVQVYILYIFVTLLLLLLWVH